MDEVNNKTSLIFKSQEKIVVVELTTSTKSARGAYRERTPMSSRSRLEKRTRPTHSAAMRSKKRTPRIHGFNDHVEKISGINQEE